MPIDGWNGPRANVNERREKVPDRVSQMTLAGYAFALERAREKQDTAFARKIKDWRLHSIRGEVRAIIDLLPDAERQSPRFAAQSAAFDRAIASLDARPASWWLDHGNDSPTDLMRAEIAGRVNFSMPRALTSKQASKMAKSRVTHSGGTNGGRPQSGAPRCACGLDTLTRCKARGKSILHQESCPWYKESAIIV